MMHLQGRVFSRLQQFSALPTALQHETNALADYLMQRQQEVFDKHHTLKLKTVYGVRAKDLLHTIDEWIKRSHGHHVTGTTEPAHTSNFPGQNPSAGHVPSAVPMEKNSGHVPHAAPKALQPVSKHAHTLLDALVLKGFLTPHKAEKHATGSHTVEDLSFKDNELLIPLSKQVTGQINPTTTVWDLIDGAVFASTMKRKSGLLEPLTHGKDVYVVVNARCKTLTIFKTDLARKPIVQLEAAGMKVAFDSTRYDHGVKIWAHEDTEILHASSQAESDALVHALLAVGATHEKRHFLNDKYSPSELHHPAPATLNAPNGATAATQPAHANKGTSLKDKMGNLFKKDETTAHGQQPMMHQGQGQPMMQQGQGQPMMHVQGQPMATGKPYDATYSPNQPAYAP